MSLQLAKVIQSAKTNPKKNIYKSSYSNLRVNNEIVQNFCHSQPLFLVFNTHCIADPLFFSYSLKYNNIFYYHFCFSQKCNWRPQIDNWRVKTPKLLVSIEVMWVSVCRLDSTSLKHTCFALIKLWFFVAPLQK